MSSSWLARYGRAVLLLLKRLQLEQNVSCVLVLQWEAFGMLWAGLGFFGLLAAAARYNDKASRIPYVSLA